MNPSDGRLTSGSTTVALTMEITLCVVVACMRAKLSGEKMSKVRMECTHTAFGPAGLPPDHGQQQRRVAESGSQGHVARQPAHLPHSMHHLQRSVQLGKGALSLRCLSVRRRRPVGLFCPAHFFFHTFIQGLFTSSFASILLCFLLFLPLSYPPHILA